MFYDQKTTDFMMTSQRRTLVPVFGGAVGNQSALVHLPQTRSALQWLMLLADR